MFHLVRLVTVHPALVHFTLGGLPLIVIAYAFAVVRRSSSWTFVGDAALVVTAIFTLGTGLFGLVSNTVLPWPGGLEFWRWTHLGCGVATTLLLAALAAWRLMVRRVQLVVSWRSFVTTLAVVGLALFTGWVGGEVLVFHSGIAVRAAGDGALAPPVVGSTAKPRDFLSAMHQVRAEWGEINTRLAWMIVQHPRDEDFAFVERAASRMKELTQDMADQGAKQSNDLLASMSQTLGGDADDIAEAAKKKSLQDLAHTLGETSKDCADCHAQARWNHRTR